ncbi:MAG: cell division protein ZapA [Bacillota bacterium]|nr:cell division protein ZapA [Bacillota bacterium]
MAATNVLTVTLDGNEYTLRGDMSLLQLQRIADLTQARIAQIRAACPNYTAQRTAMLAALQLAEELLQVKEDYLQLLAEAGIK